MFSPSAHEQKMSSHDLNGATPFSTISKYIFPFLIGIISIRLSYMYLIVLSVTVNHILDLYGFRDNWTEIWSSLWFEFPWSGPFFLIIEKLSGPRKSRPNGISDIHFLQDFFSNLPKMNFRTSDAILTVYIQISKNRTSFFE